MRITAIGLAVLGGLAAAAGGCVDGDDPATAGEDQALDEGDAAAPPLGAYYKAWPGGIPADACNGLGGYFTLYGASDGSCITRGFRIGRGVQVPQSQCAGLGGVWSAGACWLATPWPQGVMIEEVMTKVSQPGVVRASPVCLYPSNASAVCGLVNGVLTTDPQGCGSDTPYRCTYSTGKLVLRYANTPYNTERDNCTSPSTLGTWVEVTGSNDQCWTANYRGAFAYLDPREVNACLAFGGSWNTTYATCWHATAMAGPIVQL